MQNPSLQNINMVTLTIQDAQVIANLEQECFTMPWSFEQCKKVFNQKHFCSFGLKQENRSLIAYISFYQVLDEVEILNIAVLPQFRNQGLAKHLLINTLQAARKMSITRCVLEVRPSNIFARALYEGAGFKCVGKRPKYYTDTGEDALIYSVILQEE